MFLKLLKLTCPASCVSLVYETYGLPVAARHDVQNAGEVVNFVLASGADVDRFLKSNAWSPKAGLNFGSNSVRICLLLHFRTRDGCLARGAGGPPPPPAAVGVGGGPPVVHLRLCWR
jgi:hypothetical protein